jgi:hypothetical protein
MALKTRLKLEPELFIVEELLLDRLYTEQAPDFGGYVFDSLQVGQVG